MNDWLSACDSTTTADFTAAEMQRMCVCWGNDYSKRWTYAVTLYLSQDAINAYTANDAALNACETNVVIKEP
jgi:hypothetical protein